ncbi:2-keto-3-deoxy-L-rhamnonate aldolase RhmA [Sphingomonas sp. SORGH_AS870]|uniref:aldolase/citrate lyase family protein n=1 Tax=Sphingomonas sp. SORGH_AS_0870 TaxID=3041801 RepID=UPI0028601D02|nr:aldolase/citrate lyase family protein [Sphingomonas sp. SORGH_AS_0870]MDR6144254.1 2-keto-3-deoxy-L-rhamnonate aldolase RhmA [Sphingomonas sp. SORGH_AS_0870]
MNQYEKRMQAILEEGKAKYGILAVKAEFEAEGTRVDELLRLLEIARRAGVKVAIKIGGCEAIRDLIECRLYGVDYIIAPMVETPYALSKYVAAKDKVYPREEQADVSFLFNVETYQTYEQLDALAKVAQEGRVGMVFGRVDFAGSMGHSRDFVNSDEMRGYVAKVGEAARDADVELVVGGAVSPDSIPFLAHVHERRLDRFETRKVIFDGAIANTPDAARAGMELAIEFELLWLKNKRDYYKTIAAEDEARIAMMEKRQQTTIKAAA